MLRLHNEEQLTHRGHYFSFNDPSVAVFWEVTSDTSCLVRHTLTRVFYKGKHTFHKPFLNCTQLKTDTLTGVVIQHIFNCSACSFNCILSQVNTAETDAKDCTGNEKDERSGTHWTQLTCKVRMLWLYFSITCQKITEECHRETGENWLDLWKPVDKCFQK